MTIFPDCWDEYVKQLNGVKNIEREINEILYDLGVLN